MVEKDNIKQDMAQVCLYECAGQDQRGVIV